MALSNEEWNELDSLRKAINEYPASVHWDKMQRFGDLMVRSLEGKGDTFTPTLQVDS
jgi:hypothetical protein